MQVDPPGTGETIGPQLESANLFDFSDFNVQPFDHFLMQDSILSPHLPHDSPPSDGLATIMGNVQWKWSWFHSLPGCAHPALAQNRDEICCEQKPGARPVHRSRTVSRLNFVMDFGSGKFGSYTQLNMPYQDPSPPTSPG